MEGGRGRVGAACLLDMACARPEGEVTRVKALVTLVTEGVRGLRGSPRGTVLIPCRLEKPRHRGPGPSVPQTDTGRQG